MNQPESSNSEIRALQDLLRTAWERLGDPALTPYMRRELRNQMKQYSADLRAHLQTAAAHRQSDDRPAPAFAKPELRILA